MIKWLGFGVHGDGFPATNSQAIIFIKYHNSKFSIPFSKQHAVPLDILANMVVSMFREKH